MLLTPSAGEIARTDDGGLVLVRRAPSGRTEWAFPERAANAPRLAAMAPRLQTFEAAARLAGADYDRFWWWITDDALEHIGAELNASGFVVVDGFLGGKGARALREEVTSLRAAGRLQRSKLAGGRSGGMLTYSHTAVRGDDVGWFDGDEPELWPRQTLSAYLQKVDTLIAELGPRVPQLSAIGSRSKAMCACYPGGGARYVRHCDNSCDSGHGERCNGRRLTAIVYLNEGWAPLDGGELRLFAPYAPNHRPALASVQPAPHPNPDFDPGTRPRTVRLSQTCSPYLTASFSSTPTIAYHTRCCLRMRSGWRSQCGTLTRRSMGAPGSGALLPTRQTPSRRRPLRPRSPSSRAGMGARPCAMQSRRRRSSARCASVCNL